MNITVKDLLDAGVHFGHQLRRWNPKSKPYVFDNRHGISIIDLEKTYDLLENASKAIEEIVSQGKQILLVGTKRQAETPIRELAAATNMPFCVNRWMGGTLTNFETVSSSLAKYKSFLRMEEDGSLDKMHGKEVAAIKRQMSRMHRNFEGMLNLQGIPGALFVIDSHNEAIAVAEANRVKIPVIALVDSNSDPSVLSHPIPGNDDSAKSIRIIVDVVLDAIQTGASNRVSTPTKRKDITPITQEPDFVDQEDEPEVTLPEGYSESDFDDRKEESTEITEPAAKDVSQESSSNEEEKLLKLKNPKLIPQKTNNLVQRTKNMSNITKEAVMDLREKTGAGLIDCKRALAETNGDLEEAISILRKKGVASAAKKAGREAGEGIISNAVTEDRKKGILVEVNCETDFVAKNEDFISFSKEVAQTLLSEPEADLENKRTEQVGKIGENIKISRSQIVEVVTNGIVESYVHTGAKVAVMISIVSSNTEDLSSNESAVSLAKDLCMHIAATSPVCVSEKKFLKNSFLRKKKSPWPKQKENHHKLLKKLSLGNLRSTFQPPAC